MEFAFNRLQKLIYGFILASSLMKDLKYIAAYLIPVFAFIGIYYGEILSFLAVSIAFGVIPVLDQLLPMSEENLADEDVDAKLKNRFFDFLLYLNVPLVYGLLLYFMYWLFIGNHETYEYIGQILSVGTVLGSSGINVAHELGHRMKTSERVMAEMLLLPSLYMHFIIEHNMGHHKHVSTPKDPSTARYNEPLYFFWIRSTAMSYVSAWRLESRKLQRDGKAFWGVNNKMIWFTLIRIPLIFIVLIS